MMLDILTDIRVCSASCPKYMNEIPSSGYDCLALCFSGILGLCFYILYVLKIYLFLDDFVTVSVFQDAHSWDKCLFS